MSYGSYSSQRYIETAIITASPEQRVVMIYEGAIGLLKQATTQIECKDLEGKRNSINRALGLVHHLQSSLDMSRGGEISVELNRIYKYVSSRIVEGSMHLKTDALNEAANLLSTLLESWREVASQKQNQANSMPTKMVG
jgi:flagellar protein FliS